MIIVVVDSIKFTFWSSASQYAEGVISDGFIPVPLQIMEMVEPTFTPDDTAAGC